MERRVEVDLKGGVSGEGGTHMEHILPQNLSPWFLTWTGWNRGAVGRGMGAGGVDGGWSWREGAVGRGRAWGRILHHYKENKRPLSWNVSMNT